MIRTLAAALITPLLSAPTAQAASPAHSALFQQGGGRLSPSQWFEMRCRAREYFEQRNYSAALPILERLRGQRPEDQQVTYWLGYCELNAGDRQAGLTLLESSIENGQGRPYLVAYDLARGHLAAGNRSKALEWLRRSLAARYEERPNIARDPAFAELRDDPEFRAIAGLLPTAELSRVEGWRFDLDHYLDEVRRLHAAPDSVGRTPEFAAEIERLKNGLSELSDFEVFVALQRLTVRLGDGHSVIYPAPTPRLPIVGLDIDFYWFSDGVFVLGGGEEVQPYAGTELVAIGGQPIDTLLDQLAPLIPRDNEHGLLWLAPTFARSPTALRAIGRCENDEAADYTVRLSNGSEKTFTVKSRRWLKQAKLRPPRTEGAPALYLSRVGAPHWFVGLSEGVLYAQVNQVSDGANQSLADFASELRGELDKTECPVVVLDLRHNNGGDPDLLRPLVRTLVHFDTESPNHRLFVIVGRNTFSAAQNLCNAIELWTDAIFVGEPTSSRPNSIGEETSVRLPWSGLLLSISSRYFQDSAPTDHRPWIPIAIPVELSSTDYFANRDPALEAVLEVIAESRK